MQRRPSAAFYLCHFVLTSFPGHALVIEGIVFGPDKYGFPSMIGILASGEDQRSDATGIGSEHPSRYTGKSLAMNANETMKIRGEPILDRRDEFSLGFRWSLVPVDLKYRQNENNVGPGHASVNHLEKSRGESLAR